MEIRPKLHFSAPTKMKGKGKSNDYRSKKGGKGKPATSSSKPKPSKHVSSPSAPKSKPFNNKKGDKKSDPKLTFQHKKPAAAVKPKPRPREDDFVVVKGDGDSNAVAENDGKKRKVSTNSNGHNKNGHKSSNNKKAGEPATKKIKTYEERQQSKPNYALVEHLKVVWNQVRVKSLSNAERERLVNQMLERIKGHILQVRNCLFLLKLCLCMCFLMNYGNCNVSFISLNR